MYPQSLSITQPIILRLNLSKHNLLLLKIPQEEIGDSPATLLILLRHDLANRRECLAAETQRDLNQIV